MRNDGSDRSDVPTEQWVERQGSARSAVARVAQLVERILGKDEVRGSIPRASLVEDVESLGVTLDSRL